MKFIHISLLFFTLLLLLSGSAMASTRGGDIDVVLLNYEPVPAQPGNTLDVWIQVENTGNTDTNPATLTFQDSFPFSVPLANDKIKMVPSIPARESFLIKTQVRIDKEAHEGENILQVSVFEEGDVGDIDFELPISIRGRTSALSVVSAQTTPKQIIPGTEGTLAITLENVGETKISNLDVTLDLSAIPATPTSGSNSQTIGSLRSGEDSTFVFTLQASPDAPIQTYQLPVSLTYENEQGIEKSQDEVIGFVVGAEPELLVYLEKSDLTTENKQGDIVVRFVNHGLSQIKLLQMEVLEQDSIEVLSESNIIYVGNIDEDDYESADVTLKVSSDTTQLPLKVLYRDAFNQQHEEQIVLNLDLTNNTTNGNSGHSAWIIWSIVLVVIIVGFVVWRKRKTHSKNGKGRK